MGFSISLTSKKNVFDLLHIVFDREEMSLGDVHFFEPIRQLFHDCKDNNKPEIN